MKIVDLKKELDTGKCKNFYVFYGIEKAMMKRYLKKIDEHYEEISSIEEAVKKATSVSLISVKRTLVVRNADKIEDIDPEWLLASLNKNRLIIVLDEVDGRKTFFKKVADHLVEFDTLSLSQLVGFVRSVLEKDISNDLAEVIAERSNYDVGRIELECDKLNMFDGELTRGIINELVTPYPEDVIFDLINAVAKKQVKESYRLLRGLLELKQSPVAILTLLYRNFRGVLLVQGYSKLEAREIAAKTGMVIGQVYAIKNLIGVYSQEQLEEILELLHRADISIKTGRATMDQALELAMLDILSL